MTEVLDSSVPIMTPQELAEIQTPEQMHALRLGRAEIWLANARAVGAGILDSVRMSHKNVTVTAQNAPEHINQILTDNPELEQATQ